MSLSNIDDLQLPLIFIHEGHLINKVHCTKSRDEYFHVQEDCQHDFLYKILHPEFFLYLRISVFPLHGLSFFMQTHSDKPKLSPFVNIF